MRKSVAAPLAFASFVALATSALAGCNTYRDQLVRAQHTFEQNEHERTLTLLRDMEHDVTRLSTPEQAEYAYLRGMTDYRIGYRADARHWLAIAKSYDDASPGMLPSDYKARMTEVLEELNGVVYMDGYPALGNQRRPLDDEAPKSTTPSAPRAK